MRNIEILVFKRVEQCYHLVCLSGADIKQLLNEMLKPDAKVHLLILLSLNSRVSTSEITDGEKSSCGGKYERLVKVFPLSSYLKCF